ncbi:urease accessory protein UreD [Streptomyces sp. NPDC007861]|uniref:urease accessory protein UreD n=1 Tax=Streptomyces sp. NPDC007861 TaxID=3154893 RepID=UPI003403A88F
MFGNPPLQLMRVGRRDAVPLRIRATDSCAGPLGGDQYAVTVDVGPGAALAFTTASAAVALPSSDQHPSHLASRIHVAAGGRLLWLPKPTIYGGGSRHHTTTTIELGADAGLVYRETLALGLHGIPQARAVSDTRVTLDGRPLWVQETALGTDVPGGAGPALTAGARVLQQTLLVRPDLWWPAATHDVPAQVLGPGSCVLPLGTGPALLISVLAGYVEEAAEISAEGLALAGITHRLH